MAVGTATVISLNQPTQTIQAKDLSIHGLGDSRGKSATAYKVSLRKTTTPQACSADEISQSQFNQPARRKSRTTLAIFKDHSLNIGWVIVDSGVPKNSLLPKIY